MPLSTMPDPRAFHLFGSISGTLANATKTNPVPTPIRVWADMRISMLRAVPPRMQPSRTMRSPIKMTFRRPKVSLSEPATAAELAEAIDHAPTTHGSLSVPSSSVVTCNTTLARETKANPIGAPSVSARACWETAVSVVDASSPSILLLQAHTKQAAHVLPPMYTSGGLSSSAAR